MSLVTRGGQAATLDATNAPITISVNAGSGANRGLIAVAYWRNNAGHAWSGVTYNGDALTSLATIESATQYRMQVWALNGPDVGINNLVFTPTGGTGAAGGCVLMWTFMDDVDMTTFLANLATYFATGSNNAAGASFVSSQAVTGITGGFGLMYAGMRDGTAARTATAGALVGTLLQATGQAQFAIAQGDWVSDGGTDTPTMSWNNDGGDLERRFAAVIPSAAPVGPTIDTQPQSQTVLLSDTTSATFTVAATSSGGPLAYQWNRNGVPIVGATSASYTATGLVIGDDGDTFDCDGTDDNGTTASATATLTVRVGDALPTSGGTSNGSGVVTLQFTSDANRAAQPGTFAGVRMTAGAVTKTVRLRPGA